MKNIIQILVTACCLMIATQVIAARSLPGDDRYDFKRGVIETHGAIESSSLRIIVDASLHGFVEGKICDFCEAIKVMITPDTKAYESNVEVPLKRAKSRIGRFATVFYELETKNVSAIRW